MKYINAKILLPARLVKELQEYIQGGYIMFLLFKSSKSTGENYPVIEKNCKKETK